jgi:hypothetical protein
MTARFRIGVAIVGLVSALVAAQAAWSQGPPPVPLSTETLITSEAGDPGTSTVTGTCNPLGASTFTFQVTGVAVGPYPGTFVEEGTFTLGPFAVPGAGFALESFDANFTITSSAGSVIGTKTLTGIASTGFGACGPFVFTGTEANAVDIETPVAYTAEIATPGGTAMDSGESFVNYGDTQLRGEADAGNGFSFVETFTSTSFIPDEDEDDQGEDDDDQGEDEDDQGEDEE